MRKLWIAGILLAFLHQPLHAQRVCGNDFTRAAIIKKDPSFAERIYKQRGELQGVSDKYYQKQKDNLQKTTAAAPIPFIFHVIISSARLANIGGPAGVAQRCVSQIETLNEDYNRENGDSTLIPSGWKSLYASTGIRYGLAHTDPSGRGTAGWEIKISDSLFQLGDFSDYGKAKYDTTGGLNAWDVNKYLNIWCIYFSDFPSLLGVSTPYSFTVSGVGSIPDNQRGVCVAYNAFGKRAASTDNYFSLGINYADRGRTLTHELGHFFELWHTWGDDFGYCPWESGGSDDGIADTPPESDHQYGNPVYNISGGTIYDGCRVNSNTGALMQPKGIPCLDFMDYTDDVAMHMFTTAQAGVVAAMAAGESLSLTQHPALLDWPLYVPDLSVDNVDIFPNPATGMVHISFSGTGTELQEVVVRNVVGQQVYKSAVGNVKNGIFSINLEGLVKGIYFVTCNFVSGNVTKKILLL
ncbi:MAG: T9SS type A sorting domain-containing protein [Taibaiella sp.]|nr:T9SS type A sorting domain-containing protein [Taibaiella sp.]